uniref:Uncharacterized protein n=1 Tax=Pithovirus LCPAC406 TaxID=2506599 RepID=A0A481ZDL0_9VIRU|nr:MAG: hypothetical protein LCPAC406_03570 [Pithovirus LCPAC406]
MKGIILKIDEFQHFIICHKTMKFVINDETFEMSLYAWPEGSTFRLMHEGDRNADEYKLVNPRLKKDSVRLIIDVVTKDVDREVLNPDDVNWIELNFAVDYLGICSSIDYIYPLFLTKMDRKFWYEKGNNLITVKVNDLGDRDTDYDVIRGTFFNKRSFKHHDNCTDIIEHLSHIEGLFVCGNYAFAKFSDFEKSWFSIDIFAYGHDSLDHSKEAVAICLKYKYKSNDGYCDPISFRDNILISIPITSIKDNRFWINVRFTLLKFCDLSHILNNQDLDSLCIGFKMEDPDTYYSLPRFVRAYETKSNTFDPTFRNLEYIARLINATQNGFDIAIPGFSKKNLKISPEILKKIMNRENFSHIIGIRAIIISAMLNKCIVKQKYFYYVSKHFINKLKKREGKKSSLVVGDVLNEGQRDFIFKFKIGKEVTYTPEHPRIEFVSVEQDEIYQVQESCYGGYYM